MSLNPLAQLDTLTVLGVVLVFLLTLLVLRRVFFLPLIDVMEKRDAGIEASRVLKTEASAALERARREADEVLSAAKAAAASGAEALRQEIAQRRSATLRSATQEADAILTAGRAEALALEQSEDTKLADELRACVGLTLTQSIGSADDATIRLLVARALEARRR